EMTFLLAENGAQRRPIALELARRGLEVPVRQPVGMGMQLDVESTGIELEQLLAGHQAEALVSQHLGEVHPECRGDGPQALLTVGERRERLLCGGDERHRKSVRVLAQVVSSIQQRMESFELQLRAGGAAYHVVERHVEDLGPGIEVLRGDVDAGRKSVFLQNGGDYREVRGPAVIERDHCLAMADLTGCQSSYRLIERDDRN